MTLMRVTPLSDSPELVAGMVAYMQATDGLVCSVCGLEALGHAPGARYLGYTKHVFDGVPGDVEAAQALSRQAYQNRCRLELCGDYCLSTHTLKPCGHYWAETPACKRGNCKHTAGHCEACQ